MVHTFQDVLDAGKADIAPFAEVMPDDIFTFSYTSGTTGNPKGVMTSHINMLTTIGAIESKGVYIHENDVHLSYLPLPHVLERCFYLVLMSAGGTVWYKIYMHS